MIIKLSPSSPLSRDSTLQVVKAGEALSVNGVLFDFTNLSPGATLPAAAIASDCFDGPVTRVDGEVVVQLYLPYWADSTEQARFPVDIHQPADGPVRLPGLELGDPSTPSTGVIDWSQVITDEMKRAQVAEQLLAAVQADHAQRRAVADSAIAPLQDAVDIDEATAEEEARLKLWKRYRVALIRLPEQSGYPSAIDWPAPPS
ncbi:hypothetical protein PS623_00420 [Pseudomonas fluorescens]|uniref:tail fiber assembly protein n=1 Tax=Pseudomonas fluorescens TaxID=294 RepID=UPI001259F964|nr:tail fiber assembly protein [Pseudomonas fluorescens]VVM44336.1 hypothetical protein PS623_00420 [Pseudomonas fluorescens]